MTQEEFMEKLESEGVYYALTDYGLSDDDLDADVDPDFRKAVKDAVSAYRKAWALSERLFAFG